MSREDNKVGRRQFLKSSSGAVVAAPFVSLFSVLEEKKDLSRVVRVYSSEATKPWDYSANAPWNHTVEQGEGGGTEKTKERYYDYINEDVVGDMLDRGLRELTGASSSSEAWRILLPGLAKDSTIAVKMNLNNASFDEKVTTNRMDQTMPLVNVILDDLVGDLGVSQPGIILLDASRWFHPVIMKGRCRYQEVTWVDCRTPDRWDKNETVVFTRDEPAPGGDFWMPKAYIQADYIINLCLMKKHGCGITGAMKNHFGSIPSPKNLHEGMGHKSYIADLCNTPSIRNKVRINIADALFANWHNNVWAPRPWKTFPEPSPNSLILGTDPVAFDSVMLDHIIKEIEAQGDQAPGWVREGMADHDFLEYAMNHHSLGIHEHRPYKRIEYREIEL